ncbi:MAG TPA: hypothetical protein VKV26_08290 [Dehalococcoidia bacterium]|nr:hypothetical protein [Dehalococcoidia bacterium]
MNRIAWVMQIRDGSEGALREAQTSIPADVLQGAGIDGVESFLGSGYFLLVLESGKQDFQATMRRFFDEPAVQGFFDKLRPHVESGLPARNVAYAAADDKHPGGNALESRSSPHTVTSAALPLAASAFCWTAEGGTANTGLGGRGAVRGGSVHGGSSRPA